MTDLSQSAGVHVTPAAFFGCVFEPLQTMVDALVEDAAAAFGHEFKRSDVKWHESTPDGSPTQWCRLMWQDQILLELQMSGPKMLSHCKTGWSTLRH